MNKSISPKVISLVFGILVLAVAVGFYAVAFQEPTTAPPGGTFNPPINTGPDAQTKTGDLTIKHYLYGDDIYLGGTAIGYGGDVFLYKSDGTLNIQLDGDTGRIMGVSTPVDGKDAVNKDYVDALVAEAAGGVRYWEIKNTAASYTGNLGGWKGANDKCETDFPGMNSIFFASDLLVWTYNGGPPLQYNVTEPCWFGVRGIAEKNSGAQNYQPSYWYDSTSNCKGWTEAPGGFPLPTLYGTVLNIGGAVSTDYCYSGLGFPGVPDFPAIVHRLCCAIPH